MKYICPLITVRNIEKSRYFYETILEQKVKVDHGENLTFHGDFAIHLRKHFKKLINKDIKTASNSFELYFESNDLASLEKKLIEQKVEFVHHAKEQPWHQLVMRFYDLDKNIIEVGEAMDYLSLRLYKEGLTNERISEITNLPIDFVKSAITKLDTQYYEDRIPACGCYCGGCPNFLRDKNNCSGAGINISKCEKCKTFHLCCQEKGISHCYLCDEFPCQKLKSFSKRWEKYGQNFVENQNILMEKGEKAFFNHFHKKLG